MAQKQKMARFVTTKPRYLGGKYIAASPEEPKEILLPADTKISKLDDHLKRLEDDEQPKKAKLKPPHADKRAAAALTAAARFGEQVGKPAAEVVDTTPEDEDEEDVDEGDSGLDPN
jgi:hypothetical protein